jgi:hypothetical protein
MQRWCSWRGGHSFFFAPTDFANRVNTQASSHNTTGIPLASGAAAAPFSRLGDAVSTAVAKCGEVIRHLFVVSPPPVVLPQLHTFHSLQPTTTTMMLNSITTAVAALAVITDAFLIPSTMSAPTIMNLDVVLPPQLVKTEVACFDCSRVSGEHVEASKIPFTFATSDDRTALLANDVAIFRLDEALPHLQLTAYHMPPVNDGWVEMNVPLSYDTFVRTIEAADGSDGELITVDFKVTSINSEPIKNIQSLTIRLLRDEHANLHIVDVVRVEPDNKSSADVDATLPSIATPEEPLCTTIACRIHALFSASSSSIATSRPRIGGCRGRRPALAEGALENKDTPSQPGFHKFPHLRGGPPKFWTPIAGGRPGWARPAFEVAAKPVKVDLADGEDFHILPFDHIDKEGEEHHGSPSWFRHGERPDFTHGMPPWLSRPSSSVHDDDHHEEHPPFHHHQHGPFGHGWHHAEHDGEHPPLPPMSGFRCALAKFAYMVLLPMIVGIAAGLTISGVGFVFGMGVVALYRTLFRKVKNVDVETDAAEEKKGLVGEAEEDEEEEGLPVYMEKE